MSVRTKIKAKMRSIAKTANIGLVNGAEHVCTYAGSPNGSISGKVGELCYDSTNNDVYVCTTGSTTWVKIFD